MKNGAAPILFTDEQMREYVVNGYVVFTSDVPDEVHASIREKLRFVFAEEFNPGNNILPRIPELALILNSPEVRGALLSVLGEGFIEHPHRFCHYIAPEKEQRTLERNCHQDSYTPLGRPRQHYSRYARIMYYPQDTPVEMGPTHAIPGTQYHKRLMDEDRKQAIPMAGKAGLLSVTHFDVGHAAGINAVHEPRHMIKFIYVRAEEPFAPSWACEDTRWQRPKNVQVPYDLDLAWSHNWDWLCGKRDRYESFRNEGKPEGDVASAVAGLGADRGSGSRREAMRRLAAMGEEVAEAVPRLIEGLNADPQWDRAEAIYALGAIGQPAVAPLVAALKASGERDDEDPAPKLWNEGAISMDDAAHALAAIGSPALPALTACLDDASEWVRINAAFALGEMDSGAVEAAPALTACLEDPSHCVVRTAMDSLGSIRADAEEFIPVLGRLLKVGRPEWKTVDRRDWTPYDQVRVNAAMAFVRLGKAAAPGEEILIDALNDSCGHVALFALDALRRIGSPTATAAVMEYLMARRWDESIVKGRLF